MRRILRKLRCLLGRHRYELKPITGAGVLTAVPVCTDCKHPDVENITQTLWNRAERRRWRRSLRS